MNEQIKLLALQADLPLIHDKFLTGPQEKFAELIVKECAEIAMREDHEPAECIKKHFGVK